MNFKSEFEYILDHESQDDKTYSFLVKFEASQDSDGDIRIEAYQFINKKGLDITTLIEFGWEFETETILEQAYDIAHEHYKEINGYYEIGVR